MLVVLILFCYGSKLNHNPSSLTSLTNNLIRLSRFKLSIVCCEKENIPPKNVMNYFPEQKLLRWQQTNRLPQEPIINIDILQKLTTNYNPLWMPILYHQLEHPRASFFLRWHASRSESFHSHGSLWLWSSSLVIFFISIQFNSKVFEYF